MTDCDHSGYMEMQKKKAWLPIHCVVRGGTLFYYKNANDITPKGSVQLNGCTFGSYEGKSLKKSCVGFAVSKDGTELFVGSLTNQGDLETWKRVLTEAFSKEATEALTKEKAKTKGQGTGMKFKKAAASAGAGSAMGKKVMKSIVNDETTTLLNAMKALVQAESGSAKKAEELEANIVKIAVKVFLLVENKNIKGSDLLKADAPLRNAFNLLVKVFNGRRRAKRERVIEALEKVEKELQEAQRIIVELLSPHITTKNMMKLTSVFSVVGNLKFFETVFYDDSVEDELEKLIDAMDYYTQFHYN